MPAKCFQIGDLVHCRHGMGYIMGLQHMRTITGYKNTTRGYQTIREEQSTSQEWYLIGISPCDEPGKPTGEITHVVYDTAPTLFADATTETIGYVQNVALSIMKQDTDLQKDCRLKYGDMVYHTYYGEGIVISGGYHRPERNSDDIYHHVYYFSKNIFDYDCEQKPETNWNLQFWRNASRETKQLANDILFEYYLTPIYNASADAPVAEIINLKTEQLREQLDDIFRETDYWVDKNGVRHYHLPF